MAKRAGPKSRRRQHAETSAARPSKPAFPGELQLGGRSGRTAAALAGHNKARLSAAAAREPLDYRMAHRALDGDGAAAVEPFGPSLPDAAGGIGNPHRTYDTLATLRRNGSIAGAEYDAGRAFEEDFALARLEPLHASNPARIPASGPAELSDAMVAGRLRIGGAMRALGGTATPAGSAVWGILGAGLTVKEWAAACQFGQGGRSLDEKVAKGVFMGALGMLAVHYGTLRRRSGNGRSA